MALGLPAVERSDWPQHMQRLSITSPCGGIPTTAALKQKSQKYSLKCIKNGKRKNAPSGQNFQNKNGRVEMSGLCSDTLYSYNNVQSCCQSRVWPRLIRGSPEIYVYWVSVGISWLRERAFGLLLILHSGLKQVLAAGNIHRKSEKSGLFFALSTFESILNGWWSSIEQEKAKRLLV